MSLLRGSTRIPPKHLPALSLQQRINIRQRVEEWTGLKTVIYRALATEYGVGIRTIERAALDALP